MTRLIFYVKITIFKIQLISLKHSQANIKHKYRLFYSWIHCSGRSRLNWMGVLIFLKWTELDATYNPIMTVKNWHDQLGVNILFSRCMVNDRFDVDKDGALHSTKYMLIIT